MESNKTLLDCLKYFQTKLVEGILISFLDAGSIPAISTLTYENTNLIRIYKFFKYSYIRTY